MLYFTVSSVAFVTTYLQFMFIHDVCPTDGLKNVLSDNANSLCTAYEEGYSWKPGSSTSEVVFVDQ